MKLSLTVITKNEELVIRRCIESVPFADEVIVVDSGSTDRTVEICRELGAKVVVTEDYPGNGPQKNRALDLATGDWILSLDADEWLTAELQAEIPRLMTSAPAEVSAYRMRRRSSFCGRFMRHSGWWPDWIIRFVRQGKGRFNEELVHDRMIVSGKLHDASGVILHEAYDTLGKVLDKLNRYSTVGAVGMASRGRRASLLSAIGHGLWAFTRTYFLRAGFLDGREGLIVSVATAETTYYRYLKLLYLNEASDRSPGSSGFSG
jgi:glycosyltransferase involved in cell wall biosynthesis